LLKLSLLTVHLLLLISFTGSICLYF